MTEGGWEAAYAVAYDVLYKKFYGAFVPVSSIANSLAA